MTVPIDSLRYLLHFLLTHTVYRLICDNMLVIFLIRDVPLPKKNYPEGAENKVYDNIMTESVR